jgi:N-acetylglucosaminyldiphosphoundecaprenol N-acetyl-beta-D-mannosaminyltransferase
MLDTKRNVVGILINATDYDQAVDHIIGAAREGRPCAVSALAVHGVMTGALDPQHRFRLNHLDLVVPDGQPVRWALNILHGAGLRDRVYGPNLMLAVCEAAAREQLSIFLYGSTTDTLGQLAHNLKQRFPKLHIAGSAPSKFRRLQPGEKNEVVAGIRNSGAAIVFVGMGCPRQEVWAYEFRDCTNIPIIAVGAAFAFHAGILRQAPEWIQRRGLEWLFRWFAEPARLSKRYALLNPAYLILVILQAARLKHFPPEGRPPLSELLYG